MPAQLVPFLRELHDHYTRVTDFCNSDRELIGGTLEAYPTTASSRMNNIMKVLTAMSALLLPFIAGVYGMNFDQTLGNSPLPKNGSPSPILGAQKRRTHVH